MADMVFSWDTKKAESNLRKHGVSFEEAASAFCDGNARLIHDPDHSREEDRFLLLGFSVKLRLLVVSHCYRSDEMEIRIISARRAAKHERGQYGRLL